MVHAAKIAYRDYPTVVNEVGESGLSYNNTMADYARMDSAMQSAQKAIGGSSDTAQLSQSYYWSKVAKGEFDADCQQYYENTVILAVCAQLAIDGCKRVYEVDVNDDLARIRSQPCMKKTKDYPAFMKWTHEIPITKNGKERSPDDIKKDKNRVKRRIDDSIVCPMNWLQKCLDKIQGVEKKAIIDTKEFYVRLPGWANNEQISKIRKIVEDYDGYTKRIMMLMSNNMDYSDDYVQLLNQKTESVIEEIKKFRLSNKTVNQLIGISLGIDTGIKKNTSYSASTKYTRKMLNILYRIDKQKFLTSFKKEGD